MAITKNIQHPWTLIIGSPIIIAGFFPMCLLVFHFLRVRGTPVPFSPPPMLTGIFIQLFGLGILGNSLTLILFFTPLFILVNYWELKRVEEPELEKRLGKEYVDYKKRVPMFFPWRKN